MLTYRQIAWYPVDIFENVLVIHRKMIFVRCYMVFGVRLSYTGTSAAADVYSARIWWKVSLLYLDCIHQEASMLGLNLYLE